MAFSRSGKSHFAESEVLMGNLGSMRALAVVDTEKDLTFSSNLKFTNHIRTQANRAMSILGQLKRTFRYWTIDICRTLYCVFVRPHLEYAAVVWSAPNKKNMNLLETVQRRAIKIVPNIVFFSLYSAMCCHKCPPGRPPPQDCLP